MDFSTIEKKMEAKDGTAYKNVREIYADVRLVFKNAMKYNDEKDDVHVMAKTLLEKFEEKWLQLFPRVAEEVNSYPNMSTFTYAFWKNFFYGFWIVSLLIVEVPSNPALWLLPYLHNFRKKDEQRRMQRQD